MHVGIWGNAENSWWEVGILTKARSFQDLPLKLQTLLVKISRDPGALHEDLSSDFPLIYGLVASEVYQIDRVGARHEVQGTSEHESARTNEDTDQVELQLLPELAKILMAKPAELGSHHHQQGNHKQIQSMGDNIMVTELHILEIYRVQKVGQPRADLD
ncbi:hypothetical protein Mapa_007841 [Marchantia paleacea]|nr:hypothetical protein Mapa_007841 [Marchantia paleacea]